MEFDAAKIEKITNLDNAITNDVQDLFKKYVKDVAEITSDSPHNRVLIALIQTALARAAYDFIASQGVDAEGSLQTVALLTGNAMEAWVLKALSQQNLKLEGLNVQKLN